MIVTTTTSLDGLAATHYLGVVSGEAILGADIFRDFFAGVRDIVGGRSAAYEEQLRQAKQIAFGEMTAWAASLGANAVIGVDLDYETIGGSMLMVATSGTAVYVVPTGQPAGQPAAPQPPATPPAPPVIPPAPPAPPAAPPAGADDR